MCVCVCVGSDSPKKVPLDKGPAPNPPLSGEAQLKYENDRLKLALAQSSANAKVGLAVLARESLSEAICQHCSRTYYSLRAGASTTLIRNRSGPKFFPDPEPSNYKAVLWIRNGFSGSGFGILMSFF